jgi:protein O-GlcNAc transferase
MNTKKLIKKALADYQAGNFQHAIHLLEKILKKLPNDAELLHFLGTLYAQSENYDLAIQHIKKSLQFNLGNADAYLALGILTQQKGLIEEAEYYYKKVIQMNANSVEAYSNLGIILKQKRQFNEAIACFYKAIQIDSNLIPVYYDLAGTLVDTMKLDEAINICNKILQINTADVFAYYILGNILMTQGKLCEAEICFQRAIQINPYELKPYQAFLMLMSYSRKYSIHTIFNEHLKFARQFEEPLHSKISSYTNERTLDRKLKIGYVSPDFKSHSVAFFIEPVLLSHNRDLFEIFCYSDVSLPDEVTNRIKEYPDQWRNIVGISDEKVAKLVSEERIDILIDLAGHTGGVNRILLFAHKPAPVQVSWIGYPTTTGLSTIDYKIVDNFTDPLGMTEQFYTEKLLRLPEIFLCYLPPKDSPDVNILPALTRGYITFGSFNNYVKVTPEVITLWSRILKAVPNSRLIMKSHSFSDKTTCSHANSLFTSEGIEAERIELLQMVPSIRDHLMLYNQIDIGLDTSPYNGTTTTCEAMWMGVPVVTLAGDTPASRVGVSLLSNVGVKELIAKSYEEYVEIAVNLARNTQRLQLLRERIRDMMRSSPLCDAKRFTANLEIYYRQIWERWCKSV